MDIEKRVSDLEKIVAELMVRLLRTEDKLFDAKDRLRELEGDSVIALAAYYRTHPETLLALDRIDELLGVRPGKDKQES